MLYVELKRILSYLPDQLGTKNFANHAGKISDQLYFDLRALAHDLDSPLIKAGHSLNSVKYQHMQNDFLLNINEPLSYMRLYVKNHVAVRFHPGRNNFQVQTRILKVKKQLQMIEKELIRLFK